jgi:hypothetical protein
MVSSFFLSLPGCLVVVVGGGSDSGEDTGSRVVVIEQVLDLAKNLGVESIELGVQLAVKAFERDIVSVGIGNVFVTSTVAGGIGGIDVGIVAAIITRRIGIVAAIIARRIGIVAAIITRRIGDIVFVPFVGMSIRASSVSASGVSASGISASGVSGVSASGVSVSAFIRVQVSVDLGLQQLNKLIPPGNVGDTGGDSVKLLNISSIVGILSYELTNESGPFGLELVSSALTVFHRLKSDNLVRESEDRRVLSVVGRRFDDIEMTVASQLIQYTAKVSVGMRRGNAIITRNNT